MKRSTKVTLALVVILGSGFLALVWNWRSSQRKPSAQPATATVERRDFSATVLATGAVKPQVGIQASFLPTNRPAISTAKAGWKSWRFSSGYTATVAPSSS